MSILHRWKTGTAAFMALGITVGTITPLLTAAPSFAQTAFSDVQSDYWAANFIQELSRRNVIAGFPDGTFHPDDAVTRAQFAAMLSKAFQQASKRDAINFSDVPSNYWASAAIRQAYTTGFLAGYPNNQFKPSQNIPREQVLVSLSSGLNYSPGGQTDSILQNFSDASAISSYARSPIAAATERRIVVNYPNVESLNPGQTATRAQVAAFIYQALVSNGQASAIQSPYIVAIGQTTPPKSASVTIPAKTAIPVKYDQAKKVLISKDEKVPLTLTVAQNIITSEGTVLIPSGSQVIGQLQPTTNKKGSQFVAQQLVLPGGQKFNISATSDPITKTERINKGISVGAIAKDTVLGAGAAAAVSAVTGNRDITAGKVLSGAGIGAVVGLFFGRNSVDLIAVQPNTDLQLTLNQDLTINNQ